MAATAWALFNKAKEFFADGTIDLDDVSAGAFKCALFPNSYTPAATDETYAAISASEIANGDGYTTGGVALANVTWVETAGVVKWDCDDPYWDASGSGLSGIRHAVIYHVASGKLMCRSTLDSADIAVSAGNRLTIQMNAAGVFDLS